MERRDLTRYPLAPSHKVCLFKAGYTGVESFKGVQSDKLSKDTGLSIKECDSILAVVLAESPQHCILRCATDFLQREETNGTILTFSEALDTALGGGIHCGRLTEVCGVPGIGKTQLCLQLACDVQIPTLFGGLEGEVIYIDTKGGFIVHRVKEIIEETVAHCQLIAGENPELQKVCDTVTIETFLAGIHYYSCYDNKQLLAVVNLLPGILQENKKIRLVIIDSVAFHFRSDFEDLSLRTRILTNLAQTLHKLAATYNVAVVVTNQMTTKIHQGSDKRSSLVPALGESWGHACTTRIILQWAGSQWASSQRQAWLYKSPTHPQTKILYSLTKAGFRDAITNDNRTENNDNGSDLQPAKRLRTC